MMLPVVSIADVIVPDGATAWRVDLLVEDVRARGVVRPILVSPDLSLISGLRRLRAAQAAGLTVIPAVRFDPMSDHPLPQEVSFTDRGIAAREIVEAFMAARRSGQGTVGEHQGWETAQRVAGLNRFTITRIMLIVDAARKDPDRYHHLVDAINERGAVGSAISELRYLRGNGRNPALSRMKHVKHDEEVERSAHLLAGLCDVLEGVSIDKLDVSRTKDWADSIRRSARRLNKFTRRLP